MGKYDSLRQFLGQQPGLVTDLSFEEIGRIVGGLPRSARDHRAWWANERDGRHVQARGWLDAGWFVDDVNLQAGRVRMRKLQ